MVEMYKDTGPLSSTNTLQEKREGRKERGRGEKGGGIFLKRESHNKRLSYVFCFILRSGYIAYFHIFIWKSWQAEF